MFNILISLILLPLIGSLIICLLDYNNIKAIRTVALYTTTITFFISLLLLVFFDKSNFGFQFLTSINWLNAINVNFVLGIDGIALFFILLTTFLFAICILSSWNYILHNTKLFYVSFLIMETILVLVFSTLDVLFFYMFFESVLIPMFVIIGVWGARERKIFASYMFFLYTLLGSVLMLIAIFVMYCYTGTTSYEILLTCNFNENLQLLLWLAFFLSFAVKVPMVPFHIWLPEAHVEAPTPGSVILAGVLLKLGTYGFMRFSLPLFPYANIYFTPFVFTLGLLGVIYASLIAIRQTDLKRVIAYASVAHMNLIMIGLFSNNVTAIEGAFLQMLSHGLVAGALFLVVGILYERFHSRLIKYYSGLVQVMPMFVLFFLFFTLANIATPGTSSFVGEFLIFIGTFQNHATVTFLAATGMLFGGIYSLWLYNRIAYGNVKIEYVTNFVDLNKREFFMLFAILILVIFAGIYPKFFLDFMHASITGLVTFMNI